MSDSSDEEEKRTSKLLRKVIKHKSEILSLPDSKFLEYFRLNKRVFKYVVEQAEPLMKNITRKSCVPNIIKLAATLQYLAQGSYKPYLGNEFNLGLKEATVSIILEETLDLLESIFCPVFIDFELTAEDENETKLELLKKTGFPGVIGCIDGVHIKMLAPRFVEQQCIYLNSEGVFSMNTLIICDHKMQIRYIDAGNPGSYTDSKIWDNSLAKEFLQQRYEAGERNFWLLGDADFPLEPYLMTPYEPALKGSAEDIYNKKHEQAKSIIGKTIEALQNRFRCLVVNRHLHWKPTKVTKIVNVCAALHNICIKYQSDIANKNTQINNYENMDIFEDFENIDTLEIREQIKNVL